MMKHTLAPLLFLCLLLGAVSGCKHRKQTGSSDKKELTAAEILDLNAKSSLDFTQLTLRGDAEVEAPNAGGNIGLNYRCVIQNDSALLASATKFGLEFIRALITNDSMFTRRLDNREATKCDLGMLRQAVGIQASFSDLQSFLTGEARLNPDSVTLLTEPSDYHRLASRMGGREVIWSFNRDNYRLARVEGTDPVKNSRFSVEWADFRELGGKMFPYRMILSMTDAGNSSKVIMQHAKVALNEGNEIEFRIPASYTVRYCNEK